MCGTLRRACRRLPLRPAQQSQRAARSVGHAAYLLLVSSPRLPAREDSRHRDQILADDAPADEALEATVSLVERPHHAEAVLEVGDARLDAAAPAQQPSEPALLLQCRAVLGKPASRGKRHMLHAPCLSLALILGREESPVGRGPRGRTAKELLMLLQDRHPSRDVGGVAVL